MKISVLIIDDEPLARNFISRLLQQVPEIKVIGECGTGKQAITLIKALKPELIFLDIKLKDMTGFDVLEQLSKNLPLVIFATAYDTYAMKAFDYFAFDYLLKPFKEERFYTSVKNAIDILKKGDSTNLQRTVDALLRHMQEPSDGSHVLTKRKIPVPIGNRTVFVQTDDIIYITAANYYIELFTDDSKYVLRESMKNVLKELETNYFLRIHRSSIINIRYVQELIYSPHGEVDVKMQNQKQFKVSRSYKKDFLTKMGVGS